MSDRIAHYNILSTVGTGPLGPVFRARDTKLGRTVAIRVVAQGMDDPAQRARALDLVQPYTALTHQHVASLFEAGEQRGSIYLVYEFISGERLNAALAGHPMNLRRALDLASQLADALADAHALGLVHGALTASGVIVTPKGHAKILDFGLSACLPERRSDDADVLQAADRQAALIEVIGRSRVAYAAPEQLLGQRADHRADLFALGALLHEMVTGRHAFSGRTPLDIGVQVLQSRPPAPSSLNPEVPRTVDRIIARALAKKPGDRYQDGALVAADLRTAEAEVHSQAADFEPVLPRPRSRLRLAALGLVLLAIAALGLWQWQEPLGQAWEVKFGKPPDPVLVVVPFYVPPVDTPRPYYGAGFAEDLARRIAEVRGVTVLGRSSVRASAGKPPQAVAASVGAGLALTGSLKPRDDEWTSIDIEARLIDARDGRVLWSRQRTGAAQDLLSVQADIAREVSARLGLQYSPAAEYNRAALRLVSPGAYDKYLQAREAMAVFDASRAVQLFEAAAAEDPSLIEAQAGLAEALYTMSAFEGRAQFGSVQARARQAAEAAFATDPDLAATRLAMGLTAATIPEALDHLTRAVDLDASSTGAYLGLAAVLRTVDPAKAAALARRAIERDPMQPLAYYHLAASALAAGDLDATLAAMDRGQALAPDQPWWDGFKDRVRLARATVRDPGPYVEIRGAGDFPPGIILRAAVLIVSGRPADAAALANTLVRRHPDSCEGRAMLAAAVAGTGRPSDATRSAAEIIAKAAEAPDGSGWAGCGAMAAAALRDPTRTALALGRIAASDAELRAWGAVNPLVDGQIALRQSVFPWSNVAAAPAVVAALARIDAAQARARADAARILPGI
ncbi:MAG TPA: protein kinase [Vicinamibacterales bacterium]|nr:protein kinase [Vicinamibacterales bacterium]